MSFHNIPAQYRFAAIFVSICLFLFIVVKSNGESTDSTTKISTHPLRVKLFLGMSLKRFTRLSDLSNKLFTGKSYENWVQKDVIMEYQNTQYGFKLPRSLFFSLSSKDGHICTILVSPHITLLRPDSVITLHDKISNLLDSSGWHRDTHRLLFPSKQKLLDNMRQADSYEVGGGLGRWFSPDKKIKIFWYLKRGNTKDKLFIATLRIEPTEDLKECSVSLTELSSSP